MKLHGTGRGGIVISGAYGMENAGDDAVLTAIIASLRRLDADIPITVLARRPKQTARRFGVAAIHPLRVPRWLFALRRARLFLSGGGSLLQDVTSRRSLWFYLFTIRAAKRLGCAVQLYGCGIGPLLRERSRQAAARVVDSCADAVTVRDGESASLLRALGVTRPPVLVAADPALGLPPPQGEREAAIGFCLRDWPDFWRHVPELAAAARYAYGTYRLAPVFFCLAPGDRQAVTSVTQELEDVPFTVSRDARRVGRMSLVVSMRLHGLVFALRDGAPAAGVSYDPKVTAFCREAGYPCLALPNVTEQALRALIDEAAHLDAESLSAAAQSLIRRERTNLHTAAQLLADAEAASPEDDAG